MANDGHTELRSNDAAILDCLHENTRQIATVISETGHLRTEVQRLLTFRDEDAPKIQSIAAIDESVKALAKRVLEKEKSDHEAEIASARMEERAKIEGERRELHGNMWRVGGIIAVVVALLERVYRAVAK